MHSQHWLNRYAAWRHLRRLRPNFVWERANLSLRSMTRCDVLVQVDNFELGGLERILLDLNAILRERGFRLTLLVLGKASKNHPLLRNLDYPVLRFEFDRQKYRKLLRLLRPKVLMAHYSFSGLKEAKSEGVVTVQVLHNIYMWFSESELRSFRKAAADTDLFIACSRKVVDYSVERLGLQKDLIRLLPLGARLVGLGSSTAPYQGAVMRKSFGFVESDFVFISVASINHQKNLPGLIRAFKMVVDQDSHARLVLLGRIYEPDIMEEIAIQVETLDLAGKIIYAGETQSTDGFYLMADSYVSAAFFEGGPLALIEALSAGLPVVTTNVGLAETFASLPGVELVEPPVNLLKYQGRLDQLKSNVVFERNLARAMAAIMPFRATALNLENHVRNFEARAAYKLWADLVDSLTKPGDN